MTDANRKDAKGAEANQEQKIIEGQKQVGDKFPRTIFADGWLAVYLPLLGVLCDFALTESLAIPYRD